MKRKTHLLKGFLARFLVAALILSMVPGFSLSAAAEDATPTLKVSGGTENVDFTYANGVLTIKTSTALTISGVEQYSTFSTDRIKVESGVNANLTVVGYLSITSDTCPLDLSEAGPCKITINDTVHLFAGENNPAVYLPENNLVTFNGTGALFAEGGSSWPGIGRQSNGNVLFDGPAVYPIGGANSAAIGGAWGHDGGTITIKSGYISAIGGENAAGIGGGGNGEGGIIKIEGGTVIAKGGKCGAGIGGGHNKGCGSITISGGNVTATGGERGAGIGSGAGVNGNTANSGSILITGGSVTATGLASVGDPAGIGGGENTEAGTIIINGGTVVANGSQKGIGSGANASGGSITIGAGSVTANGIGTGGYESSAVTTINGGTIVCTDTAYGGINKSNQASWNGLVIEGSAGQVYGTFSLAQNFKNTYTITIPGGAVMTIPAGVTFTNNGTVNNNGTIINNGVFIDGGTFTGNAVSGKAAVRGILYLSCDANGQNWQTLVKNVGSYSTFTGGTSLGTTGSTSWYVLDSNINVSERITVNGEVNLILSDNCTLTAAKGITVTPGHTLIVWAQSTDKNTMGKLNATAAPGLFSSGIGGDRLGSNGDNPCGTVTFNGGMITAKGETYSAGIGGNNGRSGGTITVNGGFVKAISVDSTKRYHAIGNGSSGSGGIINLNGGVLEVEGAIAQSNSRDSWRGVLIDEGTCSIYGNLSLEEFIGLIPQDCNTDIQTDATLTVPFGMNTTFSAPMHINQGGSFVIDGTCTVNNTLTNEGSVTITSNGSCLINGAVISGGSVVSNGVLICKSTFENSGGILQGNYTIEGEYILSSIDLCPFATVNGTELIKGTDYTYSNHVLTILTSKAMTVKMRDTGIITVDRIAVASGVNANLTLQNVYIDTTYGNAILLNSGATLNLTLKGNNTLKPAGTKAGICVPDSTAITISGSGSLDVTGGRKGSSGGAGIGSDKSATVGTINIIGGMIYAHAQSVGGAGIGNGGWSSSGGTINITGGCVTASGGGDEGSFTAQNLITVSNAIVILNDTMLDNESYNNCYIVKNGVGTLHGNGLTFSQDLTIPENLTITIEEGKTLTIEQGVTLTNNGTIIMAGTYTNNGTIVGNPISCSVSYMDTNVDGNGTVTMTEKTLYSYILEKSFVTLGKDDGNVHWYVVKGDVTITDRITAVGDVRLILTDGCTLTAPGGITVNYGNSLTVYSQSKGTGKLIAGENTSLNRSGIGGGDGDGGGVITINGGIVSAIGGRFGSGIGSGNMHTDYSTTTAVITINGGTVTAGVALNPDDVTLHHADAAGIGGGFHASSGKITINGGTVTATGGRRGAAIGAGRIGVVDTITINGGNITAISCGAAAAIGHGNIGDGGVIIINSDTITIQDLSSDKSGKGIETYNGLVFIEKTAAFEGSALTVDLTVPEGCTLVISAEQTLTIPEGVTLANYGTVRNNGSFVVNGILLNYGSVVGNPIGGKDNVAYAGDFLLTVPDGTARPILNTDYKYENRVLTILSSKAMTVSMAKSSATTFDRIEIGANVTANLTMRDISIDTTAGNAILLKDLATLNLTLRGENTLKPAGETAGICVPGNTTLNLSGSGSLDVTGGRDSWGGGAGIGANRGGSLGTVNITSGIVYAHAQTIGGAGIGDGGWSSSGGTVNITGGHITAYGGGNEGSFTADSGMTFSNAVLIVNDNKLDNKTLSNCIVGKKNAFTINGTATALSYDLTIPEGGTLTIDEGTVLTIVEGVTLTNNGTITNNGRIVSKGRLINNGTINGDIVCNTAYMDALVDGDGKVTLTAMTELAITLTENSLTLGAADGEEHWYVLDKDLTIANRITVVGDVYLILADECTLTATQGISVSTGNSLTIYGQTAGTGKLNAGTTAWRSSIGGAHGGSLGTLVINGGVITADATASYYVNENNQKGSGAGIGNGFASTSDVGTLTVNNGTVTAIGGLYGAGIGGGLSGDGVNVIIRGGTVTAQGNSAADIGRGSSGKKNGSFSTGASGTAFIVADSISDTSAQSSWNCLIASKDKKNYSAYGDVTLTQSLTIPTDGALTVSTGGMLTIPYTYTVTNNGTLNNNGVVRIATRRLYLTRDDGAMPVIGVDYQYKSPANLVITSSEPMTVYGTGTQAADCLAVAAGITANLTLNNVYIHVTGRSPFSIPSVTGETTKVNLTLVGKNTLRAGSEDYAGLQTSMNAVLTISGTGSLNATGNTYAAGIGGGNCGSDTVTGEPTGTPEHDTAHGGTIIIRGGTINATGGQYGAGIGDGDYRGDKTPATSASVTISGGIVTATSIGKGSDYTAATPGTFSTGENGGAIISVESISNTSNSADWNYIALSSDGLSYTVNGNVSLKQNLTIPKGSTLTIPEGTALNVTEGYTLANLGTATGAGGLTGSGVITGISETLSGSLTSFGDASADMTVELWQGNTKIDTLTSTSNYSFAGVTPGAYTLKVTKAGHVTERFTVNVAVADILKNVKLYLIGDINGDSVCDVLDCMLAERVLSKQSTPSTDDYKYYDLNEDGTCDIDDYQNVVNAALSL